MSEDPTHSNRSQGAVRRPSLRPDERAAKAAILRNPEFVLDDADILHALLTPSGPSTRKIVDLRAALVDRLERRLARLVEAHRDVIDAAWDNLSGIEQSHQAALALMDAVDLPALGTAARDSLPAIFEVAEGRLAFERLPQSDNDHLSDAESVGALPPGFVTARLSAGPRSVDAVAFTPITPGDRAIFGEASSALASVALIRLDLGAMGPTGLLALGATEADRFRAGGNADLLAFVGAVAERAVRAALAMEGAPSATAASGPSGA